MAKKGKYCFNDPKVRCEFYIKTDCVNYVGQNLVNIDVSTNDTLTDILVSLNDLFSGFTPIEVTLTQGDGIEITGSFPDFIITNSSPDQEVILNNGTDISISGTYPVFTITNTNPDQIVTLTEGSNITITGTYPNFTITASGGGIGTDELVKVSANDTTAGYLNGKLVSGAGITLTENNDGGNETLSVINSAPDQVVVLTPGTGIDISGAYPNFTVTHEDTSSVVDLDTTGAQVIDTLTFDTFGHVQTVTTRNLTPSDIGVVSYTNEEAQDAIFNAVVDGTGISTVYDDIGNTFTITNTDLGSSQNIFKNIAVSGQNTVVADSNNDTLTLVAGTNITITTDDTTDSITINSTGGSGTDLSSLTVLPDPRWDVVQDNAGDTYKRTSASVFYAVDYGVVADGVTDDWAAIQAALAACNAAGGGDVILPIGIMMVSDSIKFPLNAYSSSATCKSIRLIGQSVPNMKSDPLSSTPHPQTGSIIEASFLDTKGVIDSESSSGSWGDYNFMNITIENISVRVRSKTAGVDVAAIGKGIDCTRMANVQLKNISVSITSNIFNSVQPASTAIGILYPPVNNFVMIYSDNIFITGFYYACMLFEHATIDNYFADACYYGIFFNFGNHSSHVNKACIARCKITVGTGGGARFGLDNLSIEDKLAGGFWWSNTLDLEQHPDSAGYINYQRVETDIGGPDNDEFRRTNGPYNVICLPLGENMPKWATSNRPTILPEAATIIGYNTTLSYAEVYDHTTASWIPINGVPEEPSYCDHDLGLSLKGYWDFEEDSGNFLDKSGNTKDLLRVNGTTTVTGKIVDGGGFTGSSSQYVRTNVGTGLSAGTGFTFAGWVMLDSTADTYMVIAQKGNTSTFNFEYNIFQWAGNVYWQMSTDGLGSGIVSVNRPLLRDSLWHFITGTWDGANISLQVDNGTAATAAMATAYTNNSTFLYLGSDPTPTNYITGRLDEIGIWDTALSGGELTALYNSGTGRTIGTEGGGVLFAGSDCGIDHDLQFHWDNVNKYLGVGTNIPLESIHTTGGIILGAADDTNNGTLQYTGSDVEARIGGSWVSLTAGGTLGAATYVVAANDSPATLKARADYICDGTADEVEINTALALGNVYLVEGTYNISTTSISMPSNRVLEGSGENTILVATSFAGADEVIIASGTTNITVRNLKISGSGIGYGIFFSLVGSGSGATAITGALIENIYINDIDYGIYFESCRNSVIKNIKGTLIDFSLVKLVKKIAEAKGCVHVNIDNVNSFDSLNSGVWITNSEFCQVTNSIIEGAGGVSQFGIRIDTANTHILLKGNTVRNTGDAGIYLSSSTYTNVIGNTIYETGEDGINCEGSDYTLISGNHISYSGTYGIDIEGQHCAVLNNIIIGSSQDTDATYAGIEIGSSDCMISGNKFWQGTRTNKPSYGIRIITAANRNMVEGNMCYEAGTLGDINIASSVTTTRLRNNVGLTGGWVGDDFVYSNDLSPAQITADTNNYAPTGLNTAAVLRLDTDASRNITGLTGGSDGRCFIIHNVGSNDIVFKNLDGASTASNQFSFGGDVIVEPSQSIFIQYDSTSTKWRMVGIIGGGTAPAAGYTIHEIDDTDSPYTITETSGEIVILANAASGAITINLPTAVGNTAKYNIKKTDNSVNVVTIDADGTEEIDGITTLGLGSTNAATTLMNNNVDWFKF